MGEKARTTRGSSHTASWLKSGERTREPQGLSARFLLGVFCAGMMSGVVVKNVAPDAFGSLVGSGEVLMSSMGLGSVQDGKDAALVWARETVESGLDGKSNWRSRGVRQHGNVYKVEGTTHEGKESWELTFTKDDSGSWGVVAVENKPNS